MNAMLMQGFMEFRQRAKEVGISNPEAAGASESATRLVILIVVIVAIVAAVLVARYMMKKRRLSTASIISSERAKPDARASQQPRAAKYCVGCGAPIPQASKFCPKCGRHLR